MIKAIKVRTVDSAILKLIRMWLKCAILEESRDGTVIISRSDKDTPQGGVISPLLANIYLHWFDKLCSRTPDASNGNAVLVRYADDFEIMMKQCRSELSIWVIRTLSERFELQINPEKSKQIFPPYESLDFHGYNFLKTKR